MPHPLTIKRNDYKRSPKPSTVYTPTGVAKFLFDILHFQIPDRANVFDPAIGSGRLTDPWYDAGCSIVGCDIVDQGARCHEFDQFYFENMSLSGSPDLVLCNPPFNGATGQQLYSEVFLTRIFELFGVKIPTVIFTPMGFRLNQRKRSKRWKWLRDCQAELTSIISLPLDIFEDVEFHSEILIFNIPDIKPHYFLPEEALQ